jgi:isopenicillin-N epimerase
VYQHLVDLIAQGEQNPTRIAASRKHLPLWQTQQRVAAYLGCDPADMVFHINVTQALNQAMFCYQWRGGGELLISHREYPSVVRAAREMARRQGMTIRHFTLPTDPVGEDQLVDAVVSQVMAKTVVVLVSHVTCGAGMVMPVERIASELRRREVISIVDGAHAPGLLPLRLGETDIDFYGGNLHKWFMGPKGTGFLYVARKHQDRMQPQIIGFGGTMEDAGPMEDVLPGVTTRFPYVFRHQGLRDLSPFMALDSTLAFRQSIGEQAILDRIRELNGYARSRLAEEVGLRMASPAPGLHAGLLAVVPPPAWADADARERLYQEHRITVPIWEQPEVGPMMRVSPHIWNDESDIERLVDVMRRGPQG